jgi:hypothetical protein
MAPAFELCPPGTGVAVFGVELPRTEELGGLGAPGTWPGRTSGVSIDVETRGKETRERILTTGEIRFVEVPQVLILECAVSALSEKKG